MIDSDPDEVFLVAELAAPDRDLRQAVIRRQLAARAGAPDDDLVSYLAARPADSVRSVIGLVQRVLSAAEARGAAPSAALARELLEGAAPPSPRPSVATRTSGLVASPMGIVKSHEKFVWSWPNPADRLVEELS